MVRSLALVLYGNSPRFPWKPPTTMLDNRLAGTRDAQRLTATNTSSVTRNGQQPHPPDAPQPARESSRSTMRRRRRRRSTCRDAANIDFAYGKSDLWGYVNVASFAVPQADRFTAWHAWTRPRYTSLTREVYDTCMAKVRTNIELEDDYVRAIMDRYGVHTKTEAVDLALRHLAGQPMTREQALAMRGTHAIDDVPVDASPRGAA